MNSMAAWRSGNGVGRINEVTLCRARLVAYTGTGDRLRTSKPPLYVTSHPGNVYVMFSGIENEYRPRCGDALRLESNGSKGVTYGSFHLWMHMWVAGKTV